MKTFELDFPVGKNIGIAASGGADSAILLYLLAKINLELGSPSNIFNLYLQPEKYNKEVYFLERVISYINVLLGTNLTFPEIEGQNDDFNITLNDRLIEYKSRVIEKYQLDLIVLGITKNPPLEIIKKPITRPSSRGNPYYENNVYAPFVDFDKRYVIDLYQKLNRFDLLALTSSCDTHDLFFKCGVCPMCLEREWALLENNKEDPSPLTHKK